MLDVVVWLSTVSTSVLIGYMWVDRRDRVRLDKDMAVRAQALNANMDSVVKLATDFNLKVSGFEERLSSLEFSVKGFTDTGRRRP